MGKKDEKDIPRLGKQPPRYRFFLNPEIVGNQYLVIGTLDRADWKRIDQKKLTIQDTIEALHDFKEVVIFKPMGRKD